MLCSLCFKNKNNCIELSCNHHVCLNCIPKRSAMDSVFMYQCQTCLKNHQIDLSNKNLINKNYSKQLSRSSSQNSRYLNESQCIFCWTCHQAITLNQFLKGRHQDHSVQSYQQAIPQIKNLLLQQLSKSVRIKQLIQENKSKLQTNNLKRNYQNMIDRVNQYFHQQIEILQRKRQNIMNQIQKAYVSCNDQIERQVNALQPLIDQIGKLTIKMELFVEDQIPVTQINPIGGIVDIIEQFSTSFKPTKFTIPQLPQFVVKSSIKQVLQNSCLVIKKTNSSQNQNKSQISQKVQLKKLSQINNINFTKLSQQQLKLSNKNPNQNLNQQITRKVKLVQKIKGKMKYTNSFCSTTFN